MVLSLQKLLSKYTYPSGGPLSGLALHHIAETDNAASESLRQRLELNTQANTADISEEEEENDLELLDGFPAS